MNTKLTALLGACVCLTVSATAQRVVGGGVDLQLTVERGEASAITLAPVADDALNGLIATELAGDQGWHPANTAASDQLSAFTDGAFGGSLHGLLNDPISGSTLTNPDLPVKTIQFDLPAATDLAELRISSGNILDSDGRVFLAFTVAASSDFGASFSAPLYVESDPLGVSNLDDSHLTVSLTSSTGTLFADVTNLQLGFYPVHRNDNVFSDGFSGVNPFTGENDGAEAAFSSPLVREIDAIIVPEPATYAAIIGALALVVTWLRRRN